ncbi:TonB-dependent receptor [Phenylobacterium sp.]|uniref:TonB-dependent receptor n=1 Tax=Phenylobacterium sp. TaxID=1871053 RepID=UPI002732770F|nr:TonB-dependent receptor [Phenylobacterium sp.]MDP3659228.1 TonB-dependent receptor [Phenylobacterium sp.]
MISSHTYKSLLLASLAVGALSASPAFAQAPAAEDASASASAVEALPGADAATAVAEVIVTARRQAERAQDVPIPLSAISGAAMEEKGTYTLEDIQRTVPSFTANNSNPRNSSAAIRGIGVSTASDGLDTSVGFYFDGIYLGRPGMALADLIDIENFEVLRGPQGTLFGRNTSAGVINITTRKPSFTQGAVIEGSLGNYEYNQIRTSLTGPLIDGLLAYRLTAFNTHRAGVLDNTKTGISANSVGRAGARLQLLATPNDKLSIRLIGDYSMEDDTCCVSVLSALVPTSLGGVATQRTLNAFAALGYVPKVSLDSVQNNALQNMRTDQKGVSAEVNYDLGWADLTSITGWRYWHFDPLQDSDNLPLDVIQVNVATTKDWQYSQELRLASKPGRLNWQAGAYYFQQRLKDHYILNQFGFDASAFYTALARQTNPNAAAITIAPGSQYLDDVNTKSTAWAVFGQANFELTDALTLTAGLRYTKDERDGISATSTRGTPYAPTSIPFNYDVTVKGDNVSYLLSAAYKVTPDNLLYASYSTGYKAAGLNLNAAVTPGSPLILDPEDVTNWELGSKNQFFDRRLTLNLSAFWTELSGLQANIALPGVRSYLANVGEVRSKGVEAEAVWSVTDNLTLNANGSYIDARYTSYPNGPCAVGKTAPCDLTGVRLYQSPKYIANLGARYEWDWNDSARGYALAAYAYRSDHFGSPQADPLTLIKGYGVFNARVGAKLADGKYDLSFWVDNAFDEVYFLQSATTAGPVGASAFGVSSRLGAPRTFGGTLRAEF